VEDPYPHGLLPNGWLTGDSAKPIGDRLERDADHPSVQPIDALGEGG